MYFQACKFITDHSKAEVIVVENKVQLDKYVKVCCRSTSKILFMSVCVCMCVCVKCPFMCRFCSTFYDMFGGRMDALDTCLGHRPVLLHVK